MYPLIFNRRLWSTWATGKLTRKHNKGGALSRRGLRFYFKTYVKISGFVLSWIIQLSYEPIILKVPQKYYEVYWNFNTCMTPRWIWKKDYHSCWMISVKNWNCCNIKYDISTKIEGLRLWIWSFSIFYSLSANGRYKYSTGVCSDFKDTRCQPIISWRAPMANCMNTDRSPQNAEADRPADRIYTLKFLY